MKRRWVFMAMLAFILALPVAGGFAETAADYTGLWKMTYGGREHELILNENGTGAVITIAEWRTPLLQCSRTVEKIAWTVEKDRVFIRFESGLRTEVRLSTRLRRNTADIELWISEDGQTQLYMLSGNTYVWKNLWSDVEKCPVTISGQWFAGYDYLYLQIDGQQYAVNCKQIGNELQLCFPGSDAVVYTRAQTVAGGGTCPVCDGAGAVMADCYRCRAGLRPCESSFMPCNGTGKVRCMGCGGDGRSACIFCDGSRTCSHCKGYAKGITDPWDARFCMSCFGSGKCSRCSESDGQNRCVICDGTGYEDCSACDGRGGLTHSVCGGTGGAVIRCPYCAGGGMAPAATPTPTPRPTQTPGPRVSFARQDGAFCSGAAWNAATPACGREALKQLTAGYALEIAFTAAGDGHVWICLPQSKAGWTGIGQQNPIIRGNTVIIPYDTVVKAAGSPSSWGDQLYIKGNAEWQALQIRVIYWPD